MTMMITEASGVSVYGLFASDEPVSVRYIGHTTKTLPVRLRGHWSDVKHMHDNRRIGRRDHSKSLWMMQVQARGAEVLIRLLSLHGSVAEAKNAEFRWFLFWSNYLQLLNLDRSFR